MYKWLNIFERRSLGEMLTLKSRHKFPKSVNNPRKNRLIYTNSEMSAIELSFNDME